MFEKEQTVICSLLYLQTELKASSSHLGGINTNADNLNGQQGGSFKPTDNLVAFVSSIL